MSLNAYLGISLGMLFTMIGTTFSTVKAARLMGFTPLTFLPIIMSGVLAIYGLIVSVLVVNKIDDAPQLTEPSSNALMAAGLISGFANMFSGITMGYINDMASINNEVNRGVVLGLIFAESWGLYGLIISLLIIGKI